VRQEEVGMNLKNMVMQLFFGMLCVQHAQIVRAGNFFIASTPKCGTHLLDNVIRLLTGHTSRLVPSSLLTLRQADIATLQPTEILLSHAVCSPHNQEIIRKNGMKGFYIYRDPRDFIVSSAYWIIKAKHAPVYSKYSVHDLMSAHIYSCSEVLPFPLMPVGGSIVDFYKECYLNWRKNPAIYTTTFERLVGPRGGGTMRAQLREIKNIAKHLGIAITNQKALDIVTTRELRTMFSKYNQRSWYRLMADVNKVKLPTTATPFAFIKKQLLSFKPLSLLV
jgi:hypothetical protein